MQSIDVANLTNEDLKCIKKLVQQGHPEDKARKAYLYFDKDFNKAADFLYHERAILTVYTNPNPKKAIRNPKKSTKIGQSSDEEDKPEPFIDIESFSQLDQQHIKMLVMQGAP